jgi:DNA-binding NarL/FixJ family response regulator
MEASATISVAPPGLDALVMGLVASDESLCERISEIAATAGVEVRLTAADVESLISEGGAEDLMTIVIACSSAEAQELVEQLREALPKAFIVVIPESEGTRPMPRRLVDCGADGIVLDSQLETALKGTLAAVQSGQVVLPREMVQRGKAPLSFREKQILGLVVMGFTNAGIAKKLFLAESTVKSHLSSAFTKLGVRSRHEAAALLSDPEQRGLGVLTIARD